MTADEPASASRTLQALGALGSYQLLRPLAQGGMADIYLGCDAEGRHVAVKVLNQHRSTEPEACSMFLQEGELVALLDHPNIARVLDVDVSPDGYHYLAMEYVHGADLRELLSAASGPARTKTCIALPYDTAIAIVIGAAAGLDHAHRRCTADGRPLRLVHRDVSLSNIMVGHDGSVKVVDFGIASTAIQMVHTAPGIVRGKASYMSPEQCMGDRVDHRTDVFALGVVLYELTTGARCFAGKSDFERMLAVVRGEYIAPRELVPEFPADVEQVIRRALSLDASMRYASAADLIDALVEVVAARGWESGAEPIAREMRLLFGAVPAPATLSAAEPLDTERHETIVPADMADAIVVPTEEPRPTTTRRRMARGTEAEPLPVVPTPRGQPIVQPPTTLPTALILSRPPQPDPPAPPASWPRSSGPDLKRTVAGYARAPGYDDDDQPTRGRRMLRRPPTSRERT